LSVTLCRSVFQARAPIRQQPPFGDCSIRPIRPPSCGKLSVLISLRKEQRGNLGFRKEVRTGTPPITSSQNDDRKLRRRRCGRLGRRASLSAGCPPNNLSTRSYSSASLVIPQADANRRRLGRAVCNDRELHGAIWCWPFKTCGIGGMADKLPSGSLSFCDDRLVACLCAGPDVSADEGVAYRAKECDAASFVIAAIGLLRAGRDVRGHRVSA
jgi:hypothetical protein